MCYNNEHYEVLWSSERMIKKKKKKNLKSVQIGSMFTTLHKFIYGISVGWNGCLGSASYNHHVY